MAIEFRCSQCSQLLRVPDDSAGKHARCPRCQALMPVPQTETGTAAVAPVPAAETAPPQTAPAETPATNVSPFAPAPFPTSAPNKPTTDNPFGEAVTESPFARPAAGNLNPYASPATYASYHPPIEGAGPRIGLPWDREPRTFGCWFRTIRVILGSPSEAFAMMHQTGGLGSPIHYTVYGIGMPLAVVLVLVIPFIAVAMAVNPPANLNLGTFETIGIVVLAAIGIVLGLVLYVFVAAAVGNLVGAAVWHLFLMMVGGAKAPYETTFRVTSYVNGSLMWLSFIPYVGGCAAGIWTIVLLIIGLAKAHEIPAGKAALAVLLPVGICGVGYFAFLMAMISLAVFGANR
jgi:phage FluMu protein Com